MKLVHKMAQIKSWTVSEALWSKLELLVPKRKRPKDRNYRRKAGAGRKPMPSRQIFSAIVYVLRTGCQWKALPKEYGSASAVHAHFQRWQREGFFLKIWKAGLAEYDEMEGIAWRWQSIDGAMGKAPLTVITGLSMKRSPCATPTGKRALARAMSGLRLIPPPRRAPLNSTMSCNLSTRLPTSRLLASWPSRL